MEQHKGEQNTALTAEQIQEVTDYALAATFPANITKDGAQGADFFELVDRYKREFRARNVLPSFYVDAQGDMQMGIFVRPLRLEPFATDVRHIGEVASNGGGTSY